MSDVLQYLDSGLLGQNGLRPEVEAAAGEMAAAWLEAGVLPQTVECLAEFCARWARQLDAAQVDHATFDAATAWLAPAQPVVELAHRALQQGTAAELSALGVHLLDIAEQMAMVLYVPELPWLFAKGERTGDAARSVGLAQHLRG